MPKLPARMLARREWTRALGLIALALLLRHSPTEAAPPELPPATACCMGPLTVGDSILNGPGGGDKDFFETTSSPSAAMFILGNNEGMQDLPIALPTVGSDGCSDASLVSAMAWFDKTDPNRNGKNVFDPDSDLGSDNFFKADRFYQLTYDTKTGGTGGSRLILGTSLANDFRSTTGTDASAACGSWSSSTKTTCENCLNTKGWYRGSTKTYPKLWVVSGAVLNVRPPKFVTARKVLKDVADSIDNVRIGLATLDLDDAGLYDPAMVWRNPDDKQFGLSPQCTDSPSMSDDARTKARSGFKKNVNRVLFTGSERSFGEASFAVGGFFSTKAQWESWFNGIPAVANYPGGSGWAMASNDWTLDHKDASGATATWQSPMGTPFEESANRSFCWKCQSSAIIILADGAPIGDNSVPVSKMLELMVTDRQQHYDGTPVSFAPNTTQAGYNPASKNPGGINYCDLFEPDKTKTQCDTGSSPQGPDKGNMNFMDDVAFFLKHADLRPDLDGKQSVTTYTIGFTDSSPMLRSMALAGGGKFYRADDAVSLKDSIVSAINDLKSGSTSFASAALSSVQAGGMQASAYVPRFVPYQDRPYEGHLYRFRYYSEFSEGCDPTKAASSGGDPADLNKNKKCDDVYFLDRPTSWPLTRGQVPPPGAFTQDNIVQENKNGIWVKVNTATVDGDGKLQGGTPAVPFWDAAEVLGSRSASAKCSAGGRCIFTVIDSNKDGKIDDGDNPPLEFIKENRASLQPYLFGAGDGFCPKMFARLKPPEVYSSTADNQARCADLLIDFIRGVDVFDYDGDNNRTEDRPCRENSSKSCKLGDIFHSSPIVVDPPVDPLLCALGLHNQCVMTLFADGASFAPISEPTCSAQTQGLCYEPTPLDPPANLENGGHGAYDEYVAQRGKRDRVVLVGANDGMLHAFLAGKYIDGSKAEGLGDDVYDLGTGEEMWAFIPPDLLAKLGRLTDHHEYFIDGTPMIRDIWVDGGTPDGKKQAAEYHTIAVISERGGGQRYFALDLTDPWAVKTAGITSGSTLKPFRWMFPTACGEEAYLMGQSWMNFAPKPPPIGPVRLENSARRRGWDERWVTLLNGGYSGDLSRGSGLWMVDAWSGEKLWSFGPFQTGGNKAYAEARDLLMPVAAAPAMLDIGAATSAAPDQDGFFDTMVVGDIGGQVWVFRFDQPGKRAAPTPGVPNPEVTNWLGARAFEMNRKDGQSKSSRDVAQKTPFYNIASNTLQAETGWLRTYLGSGDKQNMRDKEIDACGLDNLLACTRIGCKVDLTLEYNINGLKVTSSVSYDKGTTRTETPLKVEGQVGQTCSGSTIELKSLDLHCNSGHGGSNSNFFVKGKKVSTTCAASGSTWTCQVDEWDPHVHASLDLDANDLLKLPHNRYFGFHSYGGTERNFSDQASAAAFDDMRTTDDQNYKQSDPAMFKKRVLKDVTIDPKDFLELTVAGKKVQYVPAAKLKKADPLSPGWFITYPDLDEKTAAGSSILLGTVFWPTFLPPTSSSAACVSALSGDVGRSWQADYLTGAPDSAESFKVPGGFIQAKRRAVSAPPPEPANVISISKTGEVRYGIAVTEPGAAPVEESIRTRKDLTSDIYWLEVPRSAHLCRHVNSATCE